MSNISYNLNDLDKCDIPCTPAKLKYFSFKHYTFINQIFGDETIREIISEIFPNNNYEFVIETIEDDNEDFEGGIHHVLYDVSSNSPEKWCSVDEKYQDMDINIHDTLCQSYTLLKYRNKSIVKGQKEDKQKQRQMTMVKMYREILDNSDFLNELDSVIHKDNKTLWRDYLKEKYQPKNNKANQYIKMDKKYIIQRIISALDCWERYGYNFFIGDGMC